MFYEFSDFRLDSEQKMLSRNGQALSLTLKAFETLLFIVRNSGRIVEKDELMKAVWPDSFVEENNLSQNIFALRRALGDDRNGLSFIQTVPRRGFRFVPPVMQSDRPPDSAGIQESGKCPPPTEYSARQRPFASLQPLESHDAKAHSDGNCIAKGEGVPVNELQNDEKTKWEDLMPRAAKLLDSQNGAFPKIKDLLKYVDANLVNTGVFRMDWRIDVRYDTRRLTSEGMIRENLEWTYSLVNICGSPSKHKLTLMDAPDLKAKTGGATLYELVGSAALDLVSETSFATGAFTMHDNEIDLDPLKPRMLGMSCSTDWPVNPQRPIIHNCYSPKETAFGLTLLRIYAPYVKKVGVIFKNAELPPTLDKRSPDTYVFAINQPLLQDQALEILVTFQTNIANFGPEM